MKLIDKIGLKFKLVTKEPKKKAKTEILTPSEFLKWNRETGADCSELDNLVSDEEVVGYFLLMSSKLVCYIANPNPELDDIEFTITAFLDPK